MAEEDVNLEDFQGIGGTPSMDPVNPDDVGLNSKSAAMRLIEQRKAAGIPQVPNVSLPTANLPTPHSAVPTVQKQGNSILYPAPPQLDGIEKDVIPTANDVVSGYINTINNHGLGQVQQDSFKFTKNYKFDARNPLYQNQFYERYKEAWDYDELGFTPFRDNETLYNENASWFEEMYRAVIVTGKQTN